MLDFAARSWGTSAAGLKTRPARDSIRFVYWPALVAAACFGPYVYHGVRTEQIVLYCSALLGVVVLRRNPTKNRAVRLMVAFWGVLLLLAIINAGRVYIPDGQRTGLFVSQVENYSMPIAALLLAGSWLTGRYSARSLLDTTAIVVVAGTAVSTILAVVTLKTHSYALSQVFWEYGNNIDPQNRPVAVRALLAGRATGIFNQPAEAGIGYSLGLLSGVYLLNRIGRSTVGRVLLIAAIMLAAVGGVLAVSKIFILVGLPAAAIQLVADRISTRMLVLGGVSAWISYQTFSWLVLPQWEGAYRLDRILNAWRMDGGIVSVFTAGRLGSGGDFSAIWSEVMRESPIFGYGAGGIPVSYDSTWVEAVVVGGIVGVTLTVMVVALLAVRYRRGMDGRPPEVRSLGFALLLLIVGASVGIPVMTANRAGACLWLLVVPALLTSWADYRPESVGSSFENEVDPKGKAEATACASAEAEATWRGRAARCADAGVPRSVENLFSPRHLRRAQTNVPGSS